MRCPVCKHSNHKVQGLKADGFNASIVECSICGTTWTVSHGMEEVIEDGQKFSFLQAFSENVECDDYNYVGA